MIEWYERNKPDEPNKTNEQNGTNQLNDSDNSVASLNVPISSTLSFLNL